MNDIPWKPRTRQQEGDRTEKKIIKQMGGRVHPRSGAGSIKHDGSTDDELIEVKDANKTHSILANYLYELFVTAVRQGKQPRYIVKFTNGIILDARIRKVGDQ